MSPAIHRYTVYVIELDPSVWDKRARVRARNPDRRTDKPCPVSGTFEEARQLEEKRATNLRGRGYCVWEGRIEARNL